MLDIVNNTNEFLHGILLDHLHRFIPSCGKSKNDNVINSELNLVQLTEISIFVNKKMQ